MIFGAHSSHSEAKFVNNRNTKEFSYEYPKAAGANNRQTPHRHTTHLDSAEIKEVIQRILEVIEIHKKAGEN